MHKEKCYTFTENSSRGFTVMELIFVIIVLAILAGLMVPRTPSSITLNAQAQAVMSDLRYVQSLAMTQGQRYCFKRTSATQYQITNASNTVINNVSTGAATTTLSTSMTFGAFTNLPNNLVQFDGQGIPYINSTNTNCTATGTLASLGNTGTMVLNYGGQSCTITITATTGMTSLTCT